MRKKSWISLIVGDSGTVIANDMCKYKLIYGSEYTSIISLLINNKIKIPFFIY